MSSGSEYSDAVVASFLEKVDKEIAARVDARLAGTPRTTPTLPGSRSTLLKGIAIGIAISGVSIFLAREHSYETHTACQSSSSSWRWCAALAHSGPAGTERTAGLRCSRDPAPPLAATTAA